jgi:hypothetical protein
MGDALAVAGVLTQGSPFDDRWTESFQLRYSNDGLAFTTYTATDGSDRLTANNDRGTVARNDLEVGQQFD